MNLTDNYHITKDNTKIKLKDLSDTHLNNILALIKRKAKNGITISYGSSHSNEPEDMWYDGEELIGKEAKHFFQYNKYKQESKRRTKANENNNN